ncbi:MAG: polyribonucleotide nucleotidyltransferase [Candidatus Improbicoccus pseudotrichonymphae]|uniref:Polyribonucleotide nucleotidyltransferase n=1 Tax=Candidatus Improbicoccus pseudotrichonymphae TaxID=3033792 RepID=A0AA48L0V2_9FIRM|nr:MAG: polyribonucleotide nucleotidyltransferase [Candidatus Improbicoccus pseudotrichonymphae]
MSYDKFEIELGSRRLSVEVGKMARQSDSCFVRWGDTVVFVAVTSSQESRVGIDFFPLSVDFEERFYSVGKIPGSFLKREGKPSEKAVLSARQIDRAIRPLFPKDIKFDVLVSCVVMAVDENCSPNVAALIGVSVCLSISDIPWNGPISVGEAGLINGRTVLFPNASSGRDSSLKLVVATNKSKILMIEVGADRVSEEKIVSAIEKIFQFNLKIIDFIENISKKSGKIKRILVSDEKDKNLELHIKQKYESLLYEVLNFKDKFVREREISKLTEKVLKESLEDYPDEEKKIREVLFDLQKNIVRSWIINEDSRVDGRKMNEVRSLSSEVGLLPRVHGSALFTRGYTQVLTAATLGLLSQRQTIDDLTGEENKRFIHHYNFPSFSVGETRSSRAPARREIGHGAFVEKALCCVIPDENDFPYTIRLVSEVLSSDGSTSQASVCASTLALMDAGVPISEPVAGISCGLLCDSEKNKWKTFVDIQGIEDFFGDMDFKVAGTKTGITAIQMDTKVEGITLEIIKDALKKTKDARNYILENSILNVISSPRPEVSAYAPKVILFIIEINKIKDLIGSGGKVVQKISADCDVTIDIEQDGRVYIASGEIDNCIQAVEVIKNITKDVNVGDIFKGKIVRIIDCGMFVEFAPGREGFCHISKLSRFKKINVGDLATIEAIGMDERRRLNFKCLSIK